MSTRAHYWLMKTEPTDFSIDTLQKVGREPWTGVRNYQARNFMPEPTDFSIDTLQKVGREPWTGVRNYQARNFMRQMKTGDQVFIYHSNCEVPGIYGIGEVVGTPYPDPTQFNKKSKYFDPKSTQEQPRWDLVDIGYVRHLKRLLSLTEIREHRDALGEEFALTRTGSRLSVLPVTAAQWKLLLGLEKK